jgi:hypothetical protein
MDLRLNHDTMSNKVWAQCQEKKFLTIVGDSSRSQKTKVGTADKDAFNKSILAELLFWLLFLVERSAHGLIDVFEMIKPWAAEPLTAFFLDGRDECRTDRLSLQREDRSGAIPRRKNG